MDTAMKRQKTKARKVVSARLDRPKTALLD